MNFNYDFKNMQNFGFDFNQNFNNYSNLENPNEGYIKGNMFKDLYDQYKGYSPIKLVPTSEQAEILLKINELEFASHELRLYLDVYPDNIDYINKFNEYRKKANDLTSIYEEKYGPLNWSALSQDNMFSWEAINWPWEMEDK